MDIHDLSLFHRMLCSLSHHICTWCSLSPHIRTGTAAEKGQLHVRPGRQLVFYSTFEPMVLSGGGPMEAMGVQKLYARQHALTPPILYVGLAANVLGRVPLIPLFLLGNYTPTMPLQLRQHRSARFPHGLADAADESGREGSNVTCQRVRDQPMAVAVLVGKTFQNICDLYASRSHSIALLEI